MVRARYFCERFVERIVCCICLAARLGLSGSMRYTTRVYHLCCHSGYLCSALFCFIGRRRPLCTWLWFLDIGVSVVPGKCAGKLTDYAHAPLLDRNPQFRKAPIWRTRSIAGGARSGLLLRLCHPSRRIFAITPLHSSPVSRLGYFANRASRDFRRTVGVVNLFDLKR